MLKKLRVGPSDLLVVLILFHLISNIVWIKLNNSPPAWDQAYHTKLSFEFARFFQNTFTGNFNLKEFLQPFSDSYGPLIRILTGFILFVLTPNIKLAQFTGTIFFLLTIIIIYLLGKKLFLSEWIGLLSAFIFSFYQIIYDNSRWLLLDIPLIFFVLLSIYLLIESDFFENRKYSLFAFLSFSLVVLTKLQGLIYLIVPLGYSLMVIIKNKRFYRLYNILIGGLFFLLFILGWLIFSFKNIANYFFVAVKAEPIVDPVNLLNLTTWFHYLKLFIDYEIGFFVFIFFVVFLYYFIKHEAKHKFFILGGVVFYYILFTIFPNKDMRYLFPILPFTSLIFAKGFYESYKRHKIVAIIVLLLIVLFNITVYLTLSFGVPFEKGLRKQVNLPFIKDIVYLNLTDYPVEKFDPNKWPDEKIITDLSRIDTKPKKVLLTIDHEKINNSNFALFVYKNNIKNVEFIYPFDVTELREDEIPDYVRRFDYALVSEDDINPFYLFNKKVLDQLRIYVLINNLKLVNSYKLPTGQKIGAFKIKK